MIRDYKPYGLDDMVRDTETMRLIDKARLQPYNTEKEAYIYGTG